ncbi:hypothetical protein P7C73_g6683, partial [Tremellales sp. Uapishka_1]
MSAPSSTGKYVPPALRNRQPPSQPHASSSSSSSARTQSRTPWTQNSSSPPSDRQSSSASTVAISRGTGPTLYVFGDSFVGPLKLLSEDCVKITSFKGASAKGLNNPHSIKQVSVDLLPAVNRILAPPPYAYVSSAGRWALFVFGNVDLQINYLYQLQTKPLSSASFTEEAGAPEMEVEAEIEEDGSQTILATATETSSRGPALGPELFVKAIVKAYTSWLSREIINGPIGQRLSEPPTYSARRRPPSKVLIAAALPPLVDDEMLPRIVEKYVERLEGEHEKAQKRMERRGSNESGGGGSRTPWALNTPTIGCEDFGISTLGISAVTDQAPPTPTSSSSTHSRGQSDIFDHMTASTTTTATSISPPSPPLVPPKTPLEDLLLHSPPLCTLPVRIRMTNQYNSLMSEFCAQHPTVLSFVDISPGMRELDDQTQRVDRDTWACPVDPTNIHPLWEPTLPLWLKELKVNGLDTDGWELNVDAKDSFEAYELDKRRRTDAREMEFRGEAAVQVARAKLRDE